MTHPTYSRWLKVVPKQALICTPMCLVVAYMSHMVAEPGGPGKRIDEQIVELSIKAGEGLLEELKVKGSITELISPLLG